MTSHPECSCQKCVAACKSMPASLGVGDLVPLAEHLGVAGHLCDPEALAEAFDGVLEASEGALVVKDGRAFYVPSLVPATTASGVCVFLDERDRCRLHGTGAKPQGCREFNVCAVRSPEEDEKIRRQLSAICLDFASGGEYGRLWNAVMRLGNKAQPLLSRRARLEGLLAALADGEKPPE